MIVYGGAVGSFTSDGRLKVTGERHDTQYKNWEGDFTAGNVYDFPFGVTANDVSVIVLGAESTAVTNCTVKYIGVGEDFATLNDEITLHDRVREVFDSMSVIGVRLDCTNASNNGSYQITIHYSEEA